MASAAVALPPLDKISLIGIWIETVLYGINIVIYATCMYIVLRRSDPTSRWMLGITSSILFILITIHIGGSLQQLLEAFIYIPTPAPPEYSTLYWIIESNKVAILKSFAYDISVWVQDLVLIWRLYVVWGNDWRVAIVPFVVELAHMGVAFAGTILLANPTANIYSPSLHKLGTTGWTLDIVVNVTVTAAIAGRLWWMGRKVSSMVSSDSTGGSNRYLTSIFTIIESGAIFASVTLVMLILYETGNPTALTGIDISTQLAALTPLLIVVRVGLGLTHSLPRAYKQYQTRTAASTFHTTSTFNGGGSTTQIHDPIQVHIAKQSGRLRDDSSSDNKSYHMKEMDSRV